MMAGLTDAFGGRMLFAEARCIACGALSLCGTERNFVQSGGMPFQQAEDSLKPTSILTSHLLKKKSNHLTLIGRLRRNQAIPRDQLPIEVVSI